MMQFLCLLCPILDKMDRNSLYWTTFLFMSNYPWNITLNTPGEHITREGFAPNPTADQLTRFAYSFPVTTQPLPEQNLNRFQIFISHTDIFWEYKLNLGWWLQSEATSLHRNYWHNYEKRCCVISHKQFKTPLREHMVKLKIISLYI